MNNVLEITRFLPLEIIHSFIYLTIISRVPKYQPKLQGMLSSHPSPINQILLVILFFFFEFGTHTLEILLKMAARVPSQPTKACLDLLCEIPPQPSLTFKENLCSCIHFYVAQRSVDLTSTQPCHIAAHMSLSFRLGPSSYSLLRISHRYADSHRTHTIFSCIVHIRN